MAILNNFSNDLENTIRSFIAAQKELNKEFISKFERQYALNEKVDRLTKEVLSFKNIIQPQKDHEEIKVLKEITWDLMEDKRETLGILNEKQVEEVKMLSEIHDPLINLQKCSLHEIIEVIQKFASETTCNVHQAGFGSYIANHVLKEKLLDIIMKL